MPDQIYKVSWNGQDKINYTYDGLGRLTNKSVLVGGGDPDAPKLNNIYTYQDVGSDKTTTLVQSVQTAAGTCTYTYDAVGNILSASDGTYTNSYVYDSLNQLVRENNQKFGKTYTYAYVNGNITERKEYAYTTGELGAPQYVYNWSYGDSTWSDLLTAWNEGAASTANTSAASAFSLQNTATSDETAQSFFKRALQRSSANRNVSRAARTASTADTTNTTPSFSYDEIGNPTEIFGLQFSWNGRQLTSITVPDDSYVSRVDFGYNMDGQRISRILTAPDGTVKTTEYFYNGENLAGEKTGDRTVVYMYDNSGDIFGFTVNGRAYYYVKNAQNDVTAITNSNGTVVVYYYYDAWGEPNYTYYACNGQTLDDVQDNPILYRSYYYDIDVGFYYLNTRYYVPMFCRFLNGDSDISGTGETVQGYNLFAYGFNNPVNLSDKDGNWPSWATKVLIGVAVIAVCAAVTVATGGAAAGPLAAAVHCVAVGALKGAVIGAAVGAATGATKGAVTHRVKNKTWKGAGKAALEEGATGFMTGAITGAITGGKNSSACFIAGTAILTAAGAVAIETISPGDWVWSQNPETGEKDLKRVVQTFVNETNELVFISVNGEQIITTPEHPFYVPNQGWIGAIHLRAGDILVLQSGKYVTVEKVQHEILEHPIKVYNFEVEDFHTYYVGNSSVLVHNLCGSKVNLPKNGTKLETSKVLDLADNYLGKGYTEASPGRFVSSDGLRQVRMGFDDIVGTHAGGPHVNFDILSPKYKTIHVFFID